MLQRGDLLLLILSKHHQNGLTLSELHREVAAFQMRALRHRKLKEYVRYSFVDSRVAVYSHEVAITLSRLVRDRLVRPKEDGHLVLTESGRARIQSMTDTALKRGVGDVKVEQNLKKGIFRLERINLVRGRAGLKRTLGHKLGGRAHVVTLPVHERATE